MTDIQTLQPGQRVRHPEFGDGAVLTADSDGFVSVMFAGAGERQVPLSTLTVAISRSEQISRNVDASEQRNRRAWLAYQAHALPLLDSAAMITDEYSLPDDPTSRGRTNLDGHEA